MGQTKLFEFHQNKCRLCGASFVPLSLDFFRMEFKAEFTELDPKDVVTMAKTAFRNQSECCSFEHFVAYRAREADRISREIWERYFSKIRP
jgi:hypothetical protein